MPSACRDAPPFFPGCLKLTSALLGAPPFARPSRTCRLSTIPVDNTVQKITFLKWGRSKSLIACSGYLVISELLSAVQPLAVTFSDDAFTASRNIHSGLFDRLMTSALRIRLATGMMRCPIQRDRVMPVRTQLTERGTARADAYLDSHCANCGWFTILGESGSAGALRGACHRFDYLSAEKSPHVHADDWCFDHRPNRDLNSEQQEDLLPLRSHH